MATSKFFDRLPSPGDLFLIPQADGRFAACRVLRHHTSACSALTVLTPWIGQPPVVLTDPRLRQVLRRTHHEQDQPCVGWIGYPPRAGVRPAGNVPLSPGEEGPAKADYWSWESFAAEALLQWRWDHNRAGVLAEEREANWQRSRREATERAFARAYKVISADTLATLRQRLPGERWPYTLKTARHRLRATRILHDFIDELAALADGSEAERLDAVRRCIERYNDLDEQLHWIETVEREQIVEWVYEIAEAAGLEDQEGLDAGRDW